MIEDQFNHVVTTFDNWYSLSFWTLFATSETAIVYITEFINIFNSIAIDYYLQVHISYGHVVRDFESEAKTRYNFWFG